MKPSPTEYIDARMLGERPPVPCGKFNCAACCKGKRVGLADDELEQYEHADGAIARQDNGDCVYLSGNTCSIYERRPRACQGFDCRALGALAIEEHSLVAKGKPLATAFFDLSTKKAKRHFKACMLGQVGFRNETAPRLWTAEGAADYIMKNYRLLELSIQLVDDPANQ